MEALFKKLFALMPLVWGLAFLAPLTAQIWQAMEWSVPFGMSPLAFGFTVGGLWGLYAQIRGTWLWKGQPSK